MNKQKKGELSLQIIVISVVLVLVMVVLIAIFMRGANNGKDALTQCVSIGGECKTPAQCKEISGIPFPNDECEARMPASGAEANDAGICCKTLS